MIAGLELFAERFRGFEDSYVVIGGTACFLTMREAGIVFRGTKDIDIVLTVESLSPDFFSAFWSFVKDGGYTYRQRSTGKYTFYRFYQPENIGFPYMLELFSRQPDSFDPVVSGHLTPIPSGSEASSLSAILLDPDYYRFLHSGVVKINGISVAKPEYLIPLKAKAWLDLAERKANGERVDSKNISKHANDIATLFDIVAPSDSIPLTGTLLRDFSDFITKASDVVERIATISEDLYAFYQVKIKES